MPKDIFLGRKSSCCDCCKRTMGFRKVKVGSCCMQIEGLDDIFQEYVIQSFDFHKAIADLYLTKS